MCSSYRVGTTAYTTALKLMQIMTEKGLVSRDETDRSHVYAPRLTEEQTQRQLVRDLLERAFGGVRVEAGDAGAQRQTGDGRGARRDSPPDRSAQERTEDDRD
jgi:hypothetical protein